MIRTALAVVCTVLFAGCAGNHAGSAPNAARAGAGTGSGPASGAGPDAQTLSHAGSDDADWLVWGKTLGGNRFTGLGDITKSNVAHLRKAWVTPVNDDGEEEASPIVYRGTVYVTTAHDGVLAVDGATGALRWAFGYNPSYELQYAVNRGVGIADGRIYLATQDCRIIALDAASGKKRFDVPGCKDTTNTWYSTAAYIYKHRVIVGTSGGDLGGRGMVRAFDSGDGSHVWDFNTVPAPGEAQHDTWPGNSWVHGGAAVWAGLSVDPQSDTVFIAPGNPGPNLTLYGRKGKDLYSNSVVALDISGVKPRVRWYYQVIPNDTHDADPAMPPVLFTATVARRPRALLAVADKAGDFVVLDRSNGSVVYRMAVSNQQGILTTVPTLKGAFACPNHGGGVEWNGGSYDPASNLFLIPSTQECAVWKVTTTGPVPYVPGQPYSAGPLPKRHAATGVITAIDMGNGKVRWRRPVPYSAQGGVLITKTGLAFTTDLSGRVYALDAATGKELWHDDIGSSVVAPLSAYRAGGSEYVTVLAGEAGNQQTPNLPKTQGSRLVAYRLGVTRTAYNAASGQPTPLPKTAQRTESGPVPASQTGTLPYTTAQVAAGGKLFAQQCSSCHGAHLQGVSAPALTGSGFGHANLNASQIRTIVTRQMPLSSPGSLKPAQYAAILAYLFAYNCVPPSGGGKTAFPTHDEPAFKNVTLRGATCPRR